jgi:hypothetical protein
MSSIVRGMEMAHSAEHPMNASSLRCEIPPSSQNNLTKIYALDVSELGKVGWVKTFASGFPADSMSQMTI